MADHVVSAQFRVRPQNSVQLLSKIRNETHLPGGGESVGGPLRESQQERDGRRLDPSRVASQTKRPGPFQIPRRTE